MKRMMVRYKVKADRAAENQAYIEQVFAELQRAAPVGLRYASFKQSDGVSFVHWVAHETENEHTPLTQLPAFQAFQAGIKDRCEEQPVATELTEIGSYQFFGQ